MCIALYSVVVLPAHSCQAHKLHACGPTVSVLVHFSELVHFGNYDLYAGNVYPLRLGEVSCLGTPSGPLSMLLVLLAVNGTPSSTVLDTLLGL